MSGRVGLAIGGFDVFSVEHLDYLRRAGRTCDHLTVGVEDDRVVEARTGMSPVVPHLQRLRIVGAIRGVDEVVPLTREKLIFAWEQLRFDVVIIDPVLHADYDESCFVGLPEAGVEVIELPRQGSGAAT